MTEPMTDVESVRPMDELAAAVRTGIQRAVQELDFMEHWAPGRSYMAITGPHAKAAVDVAREVLSLYEAARATAQTDDPSAVTVAGAIRVRAYECLLNAALSTLPEAVPTPPG